MTIFCTALCSCNIIPVPNMVQMRRFQITAAISFPDRLAFGQTLSCCNVDLTLEDASIAILVTAVAHKICLAILKEQRRIDASLIHKYRLRPLPVNIIGIYIEVFVIGIVRSHHVETSLVITDRRCKHSAGAVDTL